MAEHGSHSTAFFSKPLCHTASRCVSLGPGLGLRTSSRNPTPSGLRDKDSLAWYLASPEAAAQCHHKGPTAADSARFSLVPTWRQKGSSPRPHVHVPPPPPAGKDANATRKSGLPLGFPPLLGGWGGGEPEDGLPPSWCFRFQTHRWFLNCSAECKCKNPPGTPLQNFQMHVTRA